MELPKRKRMRLQSYDYSQNGAYFITICTQNRKMIFNNHVGADPCVRPNHANEMIIKWLMKLEEKYQDVKIDKFVIMPNHIHFILMVDHPTGVHMGTPLQEMMQWFKTQTTNEYIKGVKNGLFLPFEKRIWQRSYHEHVIRNQSSYEEIWQYIDTNPIKWELDCYYKP